VERADRKPLLSRIPLDWRTGIQAISLVAIALAYSELRKVGLRYEFAAEVENWLFRPSDSAPMAIVALSAWLLYRRRHRIAALDPSRGSTALGVLAFLPGILAYAWALHTDTKALQVVSLVFNATGLVLLYWGLPGLKALWLPIVFLLMAVGIQVPLMHSVVFQLQLWTADYAGWLLYMVGVPALVSGDQILRATQAFQVVEGCSGLRSIETLTMLTVLLVDLFGRRGLHAIVLVVLAPLVAFALNGFRVLTLILNPHSEIVAIHNVQGIAILLAGLVLIYLVDGLLERLLGPVDVDPSEHAASTAARGTVGSMAIGVLVAVAATLTLARMWVPEWQPPIRERINLAAEVDAALDGWTSTSVERDYMYQGHVHFRQRVDRHYEVGQQDQYVFVAMADVDHEAGAAFSPLTRRPGSGWRLIDADEVRREPDGSEMEQFVYEKGKRCVLVRHWTWGSMGVAVETGRTLLGLDRSSFARERTPVLLRLATSVDCRGAESRGAAEQRLTAIRERLEPVLTRVIRD